MIKKRLIFLGFVWLILEGSKNNLPQPIWIDFFQLGLIIFGCLAIAKIVKPLKENKLNTVECFCTEITEIDEVKRFLELKVKQRTEELASLNLELENELNKRIDTEEALQNSLAQIQMLTDALPVSISYIDSDGQYRFANKTHEEWFGYSREQLYGKEVKKVIGEDAYQILEKKLGEVFSGNTIDYEIELVTSIGKRYVHGILVPELEVGSKVTGCYSLIVDISDRKKLELELASSQAKLNQLLGSVNASICSFRFFANGEYIHDYCSPGCQEIMGYTADELMSDDKLWISQVLTEDRENIIMPALKDILADKNTHIEYRFHHKDGRIVWLCGHINSQRHETENCWRVTIVNVDITAKKNFELSLHQQEREFRTLAENAPDVIARFDRQLRHLYVNPKITEITGLTPTDYIGKTNRDLGFSDGLLQQWEICMQKVFDTACEDSLEFSFASVSGQKFFSSRMVPELDDNGSVENILTITRDITDLKLALNELSKQADREQALNRVVQSIRQSLDLSTIFSTATREIAQLLQLDWVAILQYLPQQELLKLTSGYNSHSHLPTLVDREIYAADNQLHDFIRLLENFQYFDSSQCQEEIISKYRKMFPGVYLLVPLYCDEKLWGILGLISDRHYAWLDWEKHLACRVADQLAIAIHQSQLYQKLQAANQELERLATIDGLTNVANRRYFDRILEYEWQRLTREKTPLSLILCDIDFFKQYNDTYGHLGGDECLVKVAQIIKSCLRRPADVVARYGGEEFGLILPHTDATGAVKVTENIIKELAKANLAHDKSTYKRVTVSFGIAWMIPSAENSPSGLIARADEALYAAKMGGRNSWRVYSVSISN